MVSILMSGPGFGDRYAKNEHGLNRAVGRCFVARENETPEVKPRTHWNAAAMPRPAKQDSRV
jgi:hypothetical protein